MKNTMLKVSRKIGQGAEKIARQVGKGLDKVDKTIEAGTNGIIRAGKFLREVGDDIIKCRSDYTIIAIPSIIAGGLCKGTGYAVQGTGWVAQKSYKAGLKVAEITGRGARKVATTVGKILESNNKPQPTGGLKDKLAEKSARLDRASEFERAKREAFVARAEERGKPLTADEVMALRKPEEEKRRDEYRKILNERYKNQGR